MRKYDKHSQGQIDKVRTFLRHMGAGGTSEAERRKFRKIKRIAFKREPYLAQYNEAFRAIYRAFNLDQYTLYGGYYWKDLRPLLTEPDPEHPYRPKRRRVLQKELGACRVWSLNGPVKQNYVPYCAWCSTTEDIEERPWPGSEQEIIEPFCDECHEEVRKIVEDRRKALNDNAR